MRFVKRLLKAVLALVLLVIVGGGVWIALSPPELLRVGSGYAAKLVCSNVFVAGRDERQVLADDVQSPGHPLLRLMRVSVDRQAQRVTAALLGHIAPSAAIHRPGLGCAVVPEGGVAALLPAPRAVPPAAAENAAAAWPEGEHVELDEAVQTILANQDLTGPGMRAVVVVKNGRIVGERYGEGFSDKTPLLGWSMAKTVNAAIIGRLIEEGRLDPGARNLLPQWASDARREIPLSALLSMESGLAFNEDYGGVADVTRMLYLEPDMAAFAASLPLAHQPGTVFSYSSGTAVLLSRIWMNRMDSPDAALSYPRQALFEPLGMRSAVMEADAAGTFVGSSYVYATARDWARFGQFLVQDGVWNGARLLPAGFAAGMSKANAHSGGLYSKAQTWLTFLGLTTPLPEGAFVLQGHDGQSVTVMPSRGIVVVRLGLSPWWTSYRPVRLITELLKLEG